MSVYSLFAAQFAFLPLVLEVGVQIIFRLLILKRSSFLTLVLRAMNFPCLISILNFPLLGEIFSDFFNDLFLMDPGEV